MRNIIFYFIVYQQCLTSRQIYMYIIHITISIPKYDVLENHEM